MAASAASFKARSGQTAASRQLSCMSRRLLPLTLVVALLFIAALSFSRSGPGTGRESIDSLQLSASLGTSGPRDRRRGGLHKASAQPSSDRRQPLQLLLASHGRLMWYTPDTEETSFLHEGQGVHYGVFPGEVDASGRLLTVWNVLRPHNWHPQTSEEWLLELDATTGKEVSRVKIASRFTHDAVRSGNKVYIANTGDGSVLQLAYPTMELEREMKLFTVKQHINTLAPLADGELWAVLHNLGKSAAVRIDLQAEPPAVAETWAGVGDKAHGLVSWGQAGALLMLDSYNAALVLVDGRVTDSPTVLWQAPEPDRFLKGLAVVDDVAYFGVSVRANRKARSDPDRDCELAAFDLVTGRLLWRRSVPTRGLLNVVAAPQLGFTSPYRALRTPHQAAAAGAGAVRAVARLDLEDAAVLSAGQQMRAAGYPPSAGGFWPSGLPFLDLKLKDSPLNSSGAGVALPLARVDVSALQAKMRSLPDTMWSKEEQAVSNAVISGRTSNMDKFKPGVEAMYLVFSDQSTEKVYRFPYYDYFKDELEPILEALLGPASLANVVRMQFARMKPGTSIKLHKDMGGYAKRAHRIHIPVLAHRDVSFQVCPALERGGRRDDSQVQDSDCVAVPMAEGLVFELNNRIVHRVRNPSPTNRVQFVVDVAEDGREQRQLTKGMECKYDRAVIICPGLQR